MIDLKKYLADIDCSKTMATRIEKLVKLFNSATQISFKTVFVEEFMKKDGNREFQTVIFFRNDLYGETPISSTNGTVVVTSIEKIISRIDLQATNYNYKSVKTNSRLTINFWTGPEETYTLRASGKNCNYLYDVYKTYLKPNFVIKARLT